ncbi:MAG: hypothetical protein A2928_04800 [Candidatus Taylorbacteria bacterium RIFCSPLOWO2_01_FULL_45_15b]|uniref:Uncharacterized protein n=1 Tax=Candidatus Taylorbacteria bacterium RIFCSPLOWO2_01_FULL_45_15b TaxID=1802319 RepID=A0A1G2NDN1_9BACT|nr:MAG: hypothetical protein A2928_04800 [Candidatus Taylorbacteria bacterium RIFCSPLOWO2_01_FULL_45_15b]
MKIRKVFRKAQQVVIRNLETNSWDIWNRDKTKSAHERKVNNLIREFEKRGYSATTIETTESRQKWHCYDGGTTAVNVFETNFAFKLLQR